MNRYDAQGRDNHLADLVSAYESGILTPDDAMRVLRKLRPEWFPAESDANEGSSLNAARDRLYRVFAEVTQPTDRDIYLAHGHIEKLKRRGIKVEWAG